MKTKHLFLTVAIFTLTLASIAQNPITTLQHAGTTQVFYGQNSFIEAYNASVNGDTLNLSVGGFTAPASICKGITIFGAGHFPDSASVKIRTTITNSIFSIGTGADSIYLEGLYLNGQIYFSNSGLLNNVKIIRCKFGNVVWYGGQTPALNSCSFEECFIEGCIGPGGMTVDNLLVKHCVITNVIELRFGINAIIDGNIFLYSPSSPAGFVICTYSATLKNNIFLHSNPLLTSISYPYNVFYNNIFVINSFPFETYGYGSNNYFGIPKADIFVNQTGNSIDYTHDYHLKNPELYIGTDGTQVGLYGGPIPFKNGGLPSNPQITSKSVAAETDASGNLNINFTVKAQEN